MKTKYMSRKFIVAVCGLGITLIALFLGNDGIAYAGIALAGCFVIGEAAIDAFASTKKTVNIRESTLKNGTDDEVNADA